jgi:hypothetical protein
MVRVMEEVDLPRVQLAVLSAMANYCDDEGHNCFPSVDRIAWLCGYKQRAIIDAMHELRKSGVIHEVAPAAGTRPAEYHLTLNSAPRKPSFDEWRSANGRHARGANPAPLNQSSRPPRGANGAPLDDTDDASRGANAAPVQTTQGCKPRTLEVHSAQLEVQTAHARGANPAPRTGMNQSEGTSQRNQAAASRERLREVTPGSGCTQRPPIPPVRKTEIPIPDDFRLTDEMRGFALTLGVTPAEAVAEFGKMVAFAEANDLRKRDWDGYFRYWLQKGVSKGHCGPNRAGNVRQFSARAPASTPQDRTKAAFDAIFAEIDGQPPPDDDDHDHDHWDTIETRGVVQ